MAYSVTLYIGTGFNAVNIPDCPATLRKAASQIISDVKELHILQNKFLTHIRITVDWAVAELCDYVQIGNFYYSCESTQMLNKKTGLLKLTADYFTSAGGVTKNANGYYAEFDILDGITRRQTTKSDKFGEFTGSDPLTAPQRPLRLYTQWLVPAENLTGGNLYNNIYVSTTLDLARQFANRKGKTYEDSETGETVTTPMTYEGWGPDDKGQYPGTLVQLPEGNTIQDQLSDGTRFYRETDVTLGDGADYSARQTIKGGIAEARGVGIEGAVIARWSIPSCFIGTQQDGDMEYQTIFHNDADASGDKPTASAEKGYTDQRFYIIRGAKGVLDVPFPPKYNETIKNCRLLYGDYNKYGLITCSGNSLEVNPEEISEGENVQISWESDPRPDGKPYYRFNTINGDSEFWRNCVAGSNWANAPLVYHQASGTALTRLQFNNSRRIAELDKQHYSENTDIQKLNNDIEGLEQAIDSVTSAFQNAAQTMSGIGGGGRVMSSGQVPAGTTEAISGIVRAGAHTSMKNQQADIAREQYNETYRAQKAAELSQYYVDTTVYVPSVTFPYNSDIIRDIKRNGVLVYRYEYQPEDMDRIDKLLTMYGYQEAEAVTLENFYRRKNFDYIECSNITITGQPRWMCEGIASQLKNGVRIWHTKPDPSAYDDNPIVA